MILHKQILWLFCFLIFLDLHAQEIKESNVSSVSKTDKKFLKFYFEAERNKVLEDYNQAVAFYQKCIEINHGGFKLDGQYNILLGDWAVTIKLRAQPR